MWNPFELTTVHEAIEFEVKGRGKNLETKNLVDGGNVQNWNKAII